MPEFTRFTETITKKQDKRVVNITVKPTVIDCTGSVWFTDLMLQEGDKVTGFVINTETFLEKYDGDDATDGKRFYNGIVRSAATCVIFNLGTTAAGLDYKVYPIQAMAAGCISLALGKGAHKATFKAAAAAGDEFDLFASTRECLKNGSATSKDGFSNTLLPVTASTRLLWQIKSLHASMLSFRKCRTEVIPCEL